MDREYNLSYWYRGVLKPLDLKSLDYFRDIENITVKDIDNFTTQFKNKKEILDFLRENGLIEGNINNLYITYNRLNNRNEQRTIYASKNIFYSSEKELLSSLAIERFLIEKALNSETLFIDQLCSILNNKYRERINGIINPIRNNCNEMDRNTGTYEEAFNEYKQAIKRLLNFEFSAFGELNYNKMHDFVNIILLSEKNVWEILSRESYFAEKEIALLKQKDNDREKYSEDNLTLDDYKKQIKEELLKLERALTKTKKIKNLYKCFKKYKSLSENSDERQTINLMLPRLKENATYEEFEKIYNLVYYDFENMEDLKEHLTENVKKSLK